MELYLIRHTAPDVRAGVCYGRSDVDVLYTFEAEASAVQNKFTEAYPQLIYTSPSIRCMKLARVLANAWASEPVEDARLMELHFGEWEMQDWQEICPTALERWGESYIHEPPPGGESFRSLHQRAQEFLTELRSTHVASAALVTHGGVIRALLAEATNKPLSETFGFELSYGGVTKLKLSAQHLSLVYVNH